MATEEVTAGLESLGLADGAGEPIGDQAHSLDQKSFFRAVQDGNMKSIAALLKYRKGIDVNAYNSEGATALFLAVYKYEVHRNVDVVTCLLEHGADVSIKAAPPPSAHKISITRHDQKPFHLGGTQETKKISYDHKTPLLVALELKSSLYLKGWEYRHWDALLIVLADATVQYYVAKSLKAPSVLPVSASEVVQHNWDTVFQSGRHDLVELFAEGKDIVALKLLVTGASKILKMNLVDTNRVEIHNASYNLAKALVQFLYVGKVDPAFVERRGIDLFVTAHKYGVESLKHLLEDTIVPTPDNWIKLLTAAVESDSDKLALKSAQSIKDVLHGRHDVRGFLRKSFSEVDKAPEQLYQG